MRVVLDTSVMVAAIRSDSGASREILRKAMLKRVTMVASVPLMVEYEAVMTRPEHLLASRLTQADIGELLDAVASVLEPVRLAFLWRPLLRDANDDMVLETAVNGRADMIVTFNLRDFAGIDRFAIAARSPGEALAQLEAAS